jgi:ubiquinone/menaquinone biosynthesis C-methylase UbiE
MAATAVEAWDERWATPEGRDDWLVPHPAVTALVPVLKARDAQHVLDLGCGVGRGLRISLRQADADALPFANESFDYVLS